MPEQKKKLGRPTKLTKNLLSKLEEVVIDALYLTDEDLVFMLNDKLEKKDHIAIQTFKDYKNGRRQETSELISTFATLIKKALSIEKINLLKDLKKGGPQWQSKAWILERKFKEWNLKSISETKIEVDKINLPEIKWTDGTTQ